MKLPTVCSKTRRTANRGHLICLTTACDSLITATRTGVTAIISRHNCYFLFHNCVSDEFPALITVTIEDPVFLNGCTIKDKYVFSQESVCCSG